MIMLFSTYGLALLAGLGVTLQMCGIAWVVGLVVGSALGYASLRCPKSVGVIVRTAACVITAVPFLVLLFWLHYPAQAAFGVVVPPIVTASVALALFNTITTADLVIRGFGDFPADLLDAATYTGLPAGVTYRRIVLPVLVRRLFPALLINQVVLLHMSLLASFISVDELLRVIQRINSREYQPTVLYGVLAALFGGITLSATYLAGVAKRKFMLELSEGA